MKKISVTSFKRETDLALMVLEDIVPGIEEARSDMEAIALMMKLDITNFEQLRVQIRLGVERLGADPDYICAPDIEEIVEEYDDDLIRIG